MTQKKEYKEWLKDAIDFLKEYEGYLSDVQVKPEEEIGRKAHLAQTAGALKKFREEMEKLQP